jgi:hypothetical protein
MAKHSLKFGSSVNFHLITFSGAMFLAKSQQNIRHLIENYQNNGECKKDISCKG